MLAGLLLKCLFFVSLGLLAWGAAGLAESAAPALDLGLQDPAFPAGLQFIHFFALTLTGAIMVFGYLARWPFTPQATVAMYAVLATICFIETIDFGTFGGGTTGLIVMSCEFALYIALSILLLRSTASRELFRTSDRMRS